MPSSILFTSTLSGLSFRVLTAGLAVWLLMMPQVLNGRTISKMFEDVDSRSAPITEEEENKQAQTMPVVLRGQLSEGSSWGTGTLVRPDVKRLCGDHGEVPHPPPWVRG